MYQIMTEQIIKDKYIQGGRCKMKYIYDEEHIQTDFGHTRLNERYKACTKCRTTRHEYHKKQNAEHAEQNEQHDQDNPDHKLEQSREWRDKANEYLTEQIDFDKCGCTIKRYSKSKHKWSRTCMNS